MSRQLRTMTEDDLSLEEEFADVIPLVRKHPKQHPVPTALDRRIQRLAEQSVEDELEHSWLLAQWPRAVLVTLILFGVALMWLSL